MKKIELDKIGADIEVFIKNENDEVVTAEPFIKGTKDEPFNFDKSNEFYAVSLDNVMAEFCIPPANTMTEFINGINTSLSYIKSILPKGFSVLASPAERLNEKYLSSESARKFGCEPDFNAYTLRHNMLRINNKDACLRSAGGHIHISYKPLEEDNCHPFIYHPKYDNNKRYEIVKVMDLFLGIPSVLMEPDNDRKKLYGKAGAYRPKPYGLEYRTISNFYLQDNKWIEWVYDQVVLAIDFFNNSSLDPKLSNLIKNVINRNDKDLASELVKSFKLEVIN